MKKFFGFGSSTPPPPPPPAKPPAPPAAPPKPAAAAPAPPAAAPAAPEKSEPAAAPAEPTLVGRWKEPAGADTTEFHADGTVTERPAGSEMIRGRYSLENGTLKIKLDAVADELTFPVKVTTDTLEMRDSEGNVTKYRRIE